MKNNPIIDSFGKEKRWVNWRYETKDGKRTKVPYGSSTDENTWSTYENLRQGFPKGIVFTPSSTLLGIDIDHCLTNNLITHDEKEKIFNLIVEADTYTEISPSETGLHLFLSLTEPLKLTSSKHIPFEAYTSGRYFTFTGKSYKEEKPIRLVSIEEAKRILSMTGVDWTEPKKVFSPNLRPSVTSHMDDSALLIKMFSSKNGIKIKSLYDGDITNYSNDESSADLALCSHLAFWAQGNYSQIESWWFSSALGKREKVVKREDYRRMTITKAINGCKEFYTEPKKINSPTTPTASPTAPDAPTAPVTAKGRIEFIDASKVACKPIQWLWEGKFAKGKITILAGDPGLGKSQLSLNIASTVSTGGVFPGGGKCKEGKVVLISAEDDIADTIVPRLKACNANLHNIRIYTTVIDEKGESYFDMDSHIKLLEDSLKDCDLVIIDPITAFMGNKLDTHKTSDVRGLLTKLSKIVSQNNCSVILLTHLNKNEGTNAINRFTGSQAFVAHARGAFLVIKDKENEKRRLFMQAKNNLSEDTSGFAFGVENVFLEEGIRTSKIVWEAEPVNKSLTEMMKEDKSYDKVKSRDVEWLEELVKKYPEGMPADRVVEQARLYGIKSKTTLYAVAKEAFIEQVSTGLKNKAKLWKYVGFTEGEEIY